MAIEALEQKTAHWFPNESQTNEGKRLAYSSSVKDMVKVLDFVQFGGQEQACLGESDIGVPGDAAPSATVVAAVGQAATKAQQNRSPAKSDLLKSNWSRRLPGTQPFN